jgi:hypothetical protein
VLAVAVPAVSAQAVTQVAAVLVLVATCSKLFTLTQTKL